VRIGYGIPKKKLAGTIIRVLISSALMGIFILYFQNLNLLELVPSAALLYFVVSYIIGGVNKEDINLASEIVRAK